MNETQSDVFVFFGATGDLAYKKIFPSLQAMVKRGHLDVPVIGMARSAKNVDELRARMRDSLKKQGGFDLAASGSSRSCCSTSGATTRTRRRFRRCATWGRAEVDARVTPPGAGKIQS